MSTTRNLVRETEAARILRQNFADIIQDEDDARDLVEGQTDLNEAIELAVKQEGEDTASIKALDDYITDLKARKDRIKQRVESLRTAIAVAMEQAERKKIDTPYGTVSLRSVPPKAIITDESIIPSKYFEPQDPKLNLAKITTDMRQLVKDKKTPIDGVTLSNGGNSASIRRK